MNKLKKILVLIKNNWKVTILVTWAIFITASLLGIKRDTTKIFWDVWIIKSNVSSIEPNVRSIESDISSIESDISSIESIRSEIEDIKSDVAKINREVSEKYSYDTLRYKIEKLE